MAYDDCNCGMTENMTHDELLKLCEVRGSCTNSNRFFKDHGYHKATGGWMCPNFLKELDRATREKRSVDYRQRKAIAKGEPVPTATRGKRKFSKEKTISKGSLNDLA